jgi:dihydroorotate dehydrogenase electron transfer subunit
VARVRHFGSFALLWLRAPQVAAAASPGQFVMVTVPGPGFVLRRPLSLFGVCDDQIGLLLEVRGAGTRRLAASEAGDAIDLAGPLGSGFPTCGVRRALVVGGGIGCAPLQYLADELHCASADVEAVFGVRDRWAARILGAFTIEALSVASEDGSVGRRGTVLDVLTRLEPAGDTVVYACGPSGMLGAVARWSAGHGLRGYASLEAHMACGAGACHGCIVDTARGRLRVCSEGPVFPFEELYS